MAPRRGLPPAGQAARDAFEPAGEVIEAALADTRRRVAGMARSGMTNREIARELFVTVKAVQWHLGNTYRKLDVKGREGLAEALGEADDSAEVLEP